MCDQCKTSFLNRGVPRRRFLKCLGAAVLGVSAAGRLAGAVKGPPPKPENVLSPDSALERLMQGNHRYVQGALHRHDFIAERPALALGQNPFAAILGCADSRVAPEYAFDTGRGDLFVCRVAGNFADEASIGSFEYAVAKLGAPLIFVLGHSKCGAIEATIEQVKGSASFPGHIPEITKALTSAVRAELDQPGDLVSNAVKQNVLLNVQKLKTAGPILSKAVEEKKLRIAGGVYNLYTGHVEILV